MGAEKIAESQSAQQQWGNICLNLCKPGKESEADRGEPPDGRKPGVPTRPPGARDLVAPSAWSFLVMPGVLWTLMAAAT